MKTYDNLYLEIISLPNLYMAYENSIKGKKGKFKVLDFELNLHENLWQIHEELLQGFYNVSEYSEFYVIDYKKRKILAPSLKDSIVQHAIYNFLEQIYEEVFIYDSYACRKNKGTHKGLRRLRNFLHKHQSDEYFIKCDISKYFYSIDHYKLKEILRKKVKDELLIQLLDKFIDSHFEIEISAHVNNPNFEEQRKGIPIGNLLSQLFSNIYLNELDYFVKHKLGIRYYLRYVDDFLIIVEFNNELKLIFEIKKFLSKELFLKLENKKIQINKISFGVDFVGFVVFKRFIRVRTRNYRRFRDKLNEKIILYNQNKTTKEELNASFESYLGHLSHSNSTKIKERIIQIRVMTFSKAVQRGGNWNNGANAGPFCTNLNNDPTNTNNNIGFRCCSGSLKEVNSLRSFDNLEMQELLHSLGRMKTGAGIKHIECNSCNDDKNKNVLELKKKTLNFVNKCRGIFNE
jgi:RNA-directed DNA polymerase